MTDISIAGVVGTNPLGITSSDGTLFTRFRVAVTKKYRDNNGELKYGKTQWLTAKAWGNTAENILSSVNKGDPVILSGRLQIENWHKEDKKGIDVCVHLNSIGLDLKYGKISAFERVSRYKNNDSVKANYDIDPNHDSSNAFDEINIEAFTENSDVKVYDQSSVLC